LRSLRLLGDPATLQMKKLDIAQLEAAARKA
jgi:hypothetical protein